MDSTATITEVSDQKSPQVDEVKPPYAPFPTFKNFIEKLKTTGVPHRVDKSVMLNLSGAAQSQILLTMRFLKLIDVGGNPSDHLQQLVESFGTPTWATVLHSITKAAYLPVVDGLDLLKATPAQLSEAFKDKGKTDGTVTEKATRFYLKGLEESGIKFSTHLGRNSGGRSAGRRRRPTDASDAPSSDNAKKIEGDTPIVPPNGMISFLIHLPGRPIGQLMIPNDIEDDEVSMVEAQIAYLRLYAKRNAEKRKNVEIG